jgi:hypothetical protein
MSARRGHHVGMMCGGSGAKEATKEQEKMIYLYPRCESSHCMIMVTTVILWLPWGHTPDNKAYNQLTYYAKGMRQKV